MKRRVLFVSPHFPPVNAPDHQRVRTMLPFLADRGWSPEVLCVDAAAVEGAQDERLARALPTGLPIHRSGAIPLRLTRWLGCGQLGYRAYLHLRAAGDRLMRQQKFDLVFFSTAIFEALNLGPRWRHQFGVPYLVDMHDPWVTDYYDRPGAAAPPGGRLKFALSQGLARRCEPRVMRSAAHVLCVSPDYPASLLKRHPSLSPDRFSVLPFGAPTHDFATLKELSARPAIWRDAPTRPRWLYLGRVVPGMSLPLAGLFRWLKGHTQNAARASGPELWFVGTKYSARDLEPDFATTLAVAEGVTQAVHEISQRVPYFDGLALLQTSTVNLIIGSDDPSYTASKIYPTLLAGRPVLALIHRASAAIDRLRECSNAVVIPFDSGDTPETIAVRLNAELGAPHQPRLPAELEVRAECLEPFTDRGMTATLVKLMDRLVHGS